MMTKKKFHIEIDATHLLCPEPLLKTKQALGTLKSGEIIKIITTDPAADLDFKVFVEVTGHKLLAVETLSPNTRVFWIQKL